MRRLKRIVVGGIVAAALPLSGCVTTRTTVEAGIREVEQLQVRAALTGDRATLEKVFAADFRLINPSGAVASRDELLRLLASGAPPYRAATYTTDRILPYGKVVVTTGTEDVEFGAGAQAGARQKRRITQVWELRDGRWQLVLRQATLVTP
jgi:hypothetical protein